MAASVRWGILGTGVIARAFATDLRESHTGVLESVASRDIARAESFAVEFSCGGAHGTYESLLADGRVDAVYVATPHPLHARWSIRAAEAGKHVLCEKPLTVNAAEAEAVVEAALEHGVFLMEAFMYRCHPQTARLVELLREGVVGDVRVIEAVHSFRGGDDPGGRLLNLALGGGGILDVGCYCMSGARLVAGVATGSDFADPVELTGAAHVGATGVDEWAVAAVKFPEGVVAHLSCGVRVHQAPVLRVHGSRGSITLENPWLPTVRGGRTTQIRIDRGGTSQTIEVTADRPLYAYEADVLAAAAASGKLDAEAPATTWADSLSNMRALDRWRGAVGVRHEQDDERGLVSPVHGRPLLVRGSATMPAGEVEGVGKPISRVVLGTMVADSSASLARAMGVFDSFYERGGNAFDTAWVYAPGHASESAFGFWLESRGVRERVVVVAKGAHTPHCDPASISRQLAESLERMRTGYADIYFMHRDDQDVPVGEFVDALNVEHRAGRIRAFGGSNWTSRRIDEANAYASERGLVGFAAFSNHFSLARMIRPTYPGTVSASTPEFRAWITKTRLPLFAWSSQAAGFFAGLQRDGFLAESWFDEDNLERRRRATDVATRFGVRPVAVALAWVLAQDLPIFPIIGPRTLEELRTSLDALRVTLDRPQLETLDLR